MGEGSMQLSIITINFNNAEGLRRTLESVAVQTYEHVEHIIVDGGSSDDSVDVIKEYVAKVESRESRVESVMWVSEKDNGVYHAMNKGIEIALGKRVVDALNRSEQSEDKNKDLPDYIQILNSGDLLAAPDVTERMINQLLTLSSSLLTENRPAIFYGNMLKSYDGKTIINKDTCGGAGATESFLYFYRGTLNHDCAYIRRDLFDKYGLYNEEMKICSDWAWYVKTIALGGEKTVYTNIDVTIFDMNGVSESGGKNAELIKKERREYLEKILPAMVLKDYDTYAFPISQYKRLKRHYMWGIVNFIERVCFKLEKWHII